MRCIVLYGPPAAGKETVAHELQKTLSANILDNRYVIDIVQPLIGENHPELVKLVYSLQLQIINAAMRFGQKDIIITFTFSASAQPDMAFIQTVLEEAARHNVRLDLIHLTAKRRILLERVTNPARVAARKLADAGILDAMFKQYDMESPFPSEHSITINTTHLTPRETAEQIIRATSPEK